MEFTVEGQPQGKARARTFYDKRANKMRSITPQQTRSYEDVIRWSYNAAGGQYLGEAFISVKIMAFYPVPKSWSKKNREAALNGEILPTTKPDCDNIGKAVLDALNGVAYYDDKQVVRLCVGKRYGEIGRLSVQIDVI